MENKWRAARYGIDGEMIDFGREEAVPTRHLILEYLDFVDDVVDELGCREEVNHIRWILDHGTGADRQLRLWDQQGQDLKAVVEFMLAETKAGL